MGSCSTNNPNTFKIVGNVYGLNSRDLIYAKVENGKPVYLDTIRVSSENFNYTTANINQGDFRFLIPIYNQKKFIKLFIDNSNIRVEGYIDSIANLEITGSVSHTLFENLMKDYSLIEKKSKVISLELQLSEMEGDEIKSKKLEDDLYNNESNKSKLFLNFAKEHPQNDLSAWVLYQIVYFNDYNTLKSVYDKFSEKVKISSFAKDLDFVLKEMSKTAIGSKAPEFVLPNTKKEMISLKSYLGKYVLLKFWSPLCYYCREENPSTVKIYNKYKGSEFEIIGINIEEEHDEELWKLVIAEDKLSFPQLLDTIGIADAYKVNNTPYNILLDREGKILAKNLHGDDLEAKLIELFNKGNL